MTTPDIDRLREIVNAGFILSPAACREVLDAAEENVRLRAELATNQTAYNEAYMIAVAAKNDAETLRAELAAEREAVKVLAEECSASESHDNVIQDIEPRLDQTRLTSDDRGRLRHTHARLLQAGQARVQNAIALAAIEAARRGDAT